MNGTNYIMRKLKINTALCLATGLYTTAYNPGWKAATPKTEDMELSRIIVYKMKQNEWA